MDEKYSPDIYDWSFPELELGPSEEEEDNSPAVIDEEEEKNQAQEVVEEKQEEAAQETPAENLINDNELVTIKANLEEKIAVMSHIIEKLKYPMSIIDDELIEVIADIIKKTVAKIIHKEMKSDPSLISKMIKELISLIEPQDEMVTINVSKEDYQHLEEIGQGKPERMSVNESLKKGDVIIKSNYSEVRAIMSERIDNLLRIQYE